MGFEATEPADPPTAELGLEAGAMYLPAAKFGIYPEANFLLYLGPTALIASSKLAVARKDGFKASLTLDKFSTPAFLSSLAVNKLVNLFLAASSGEGLYITPPILASATLSSLLDLKPVSSSLDSSI